MVKKFPHEFRKKLRRHRGIGYNHNYLANWSDWPTRTGCKDFLKIGPRVLAGSRSEALVIAFAVIYSLGLTWLLTAPLGVVHPHQSGYLREFPGSLKRGTADALVNVLLFVPLGWGVHWLGRRRIASGTLMTLLVGCLFSLSLETIQYFLGTRYSSIADVASNALGTGVGAWLDRRAAQRGP